MKITANPYRGQGLDHPTLSDIPWPSQNADAPRALLARCPDAGPTPLNSSAELAAAAGLAEFWVKDERNRMGLGSFKALGAAYVIACDAQNGQARGQTYVAASAGNHGLSVAAGARVFGAQSQIYLAETVPESFANRLRSEGAQVVRAGAVYEASMDAAMDAAARDGTILLSDSSWTGYVDRPWRLMEGYLAMFAEITDELEHAPTHIFLQAGVGGLAVACAVYARKIWGDAPKIVVVEPEFAPALLGSIRVGAPMESPGPVSAMGRLDCKTPSLIALKGLARDADFFVTLTEEEAAAGTATAAQAGLASTPSGAAGVAAVLASTSIADQLGLDQGSRVLTILSEGPES